MINDQEILLSIVKNWDINPEPEYRGFRCANCQNYIDKAFYHFLNIENYKTHVHLCVECEKLFKENKIEKKENEISKKNFKTHYPDLESKFEALISNWVTNSDPALKVFYCDNCGNDLDLIDGQIRGWHVWYESEIISELHFCKKCGVEMRIS
jgi:hypothetical protein